MKDDSSNTSSTSLKEEWSLLVHSFLDENSKKEEIKNQLQSESLTPDRLKSLKRDLSFRRRKLNQAIENIKVQIEQIGVVLENLHLVGSDTTGLQSQIDQLNREGEQISSELIEIDQEIKKIREIQEPAVL